MSILLFIFSFLLSRIGWNLTLEYCISSAAIARGWGDYFYDFWVGWGFENTPTWLNHIPCGSTYLSPAAAFIVLVCTIVMLFGISTSSTFNVIMTILNVFVLLFFAAVGATRVNPSNWVAVNNSFLPYGAASLFAGAGRVFFAYLGFDMVSSLAEETRHPQKNIPRGIIASLVIATALYVSVSLVATGMVDFRQLSPDGPSHNAPLSYAMEVVDLHWAGRVISFGSIFGLTTATFTCLLGQPRIFYTMARDVCLEYTLCTISLFITCPCYALGVQILIFTSTSVYNQFKLIYTYLLCCLRCYAARVLKFAYNSNIEQ